MDFESREIISGRYGVSERAEKQLTSFFTSLANRGLRPVSCTVDGNPQVIQVIRRLWPGITIQRCLVHIQRQGLSWCRRYPKTAYGRMLRNIFLGITPIRSHGEAESLLKEINSWEQQYGPLIRSRQEKGRVFSDIKRARSMLLKALPDMFHYLDDSHISPTTNNLEGYFSKLKGHYRQHCGLSKRNLENYFGWYFYFRSK